MRTSWLRICAIVALSGILSTAVARSQCNPIPAPAKQCSYEALNGNCTVVINRFNAVSPPTIYVRRGQEVKVLVVNPTPFEDLWFDQKSNTLQVPPDQFYTGFSTLTTVLGSIEIVSPEELGAEARANIPMRMLLPAAPPPPTIAGILESQVALSGDIATAMTASNPLQLAQVALAQIKHVERSMPADVCQGHSEIHDAFLSPATWKAAADASLDSAVARVNEILRHGQYPAPADVNASCPHDPATDLRLTCQIQSLDGRIVSLSAGAGNPDAFAALRDNQQTLNSAVSALTQIGNKLKGLKEEIDAHIPPEEHTRVYRITDGQPHSHNYDVQTWNIDASVRLAGVAKRVSGDKYVDPSSGALANLADAPTKTTVATVTVQFQPDNRYEISTGLLVPFKPFNTYTAAQAYSATAPVVQRTKTYTVIPMADVNFLLRNEWVAAKQRMAAFVTVGVGYCPATTSVAFGVGPSLSWRSVVLNPMLDIGRDARLAPGFTVGQPLGGPTNTTPAAAPVTSNQWVFYPGFGVSVRIPLGGSSN